MIQPYIKISLALAMQIQSELIKKPQIFPLGNSLFVGSLSLYKKIIFQWSIFTG